MGTLASVELRISPLVHLLGDTGPDLDGPVLSMLKRMAEFSIKGEFLAANQEYMDGTIAHTQWHDGFQKAMPAGGNKANPGMAKRHKSFDPRNALYETESYHYLLSFKRLVAVSQLLFVD